jgi:arginine deiminase
MAIRIDSEIGRLRQVLVHRPGEEIVRMTQHELELLLFDDLLSPVETVLEHDMMVEIMRVARADVVELDDLLRRALERAPREARVQLLERACELAGTQDLSAELSAWEPERLANLLVGGVYWDELREARVTLERLRKQLLTPPTMALGPVPNLMFMRDPCIAVGDRVIVGRMATAARAREPALVSFALVHGGLVEPAKVLFEPSDDHRHKSFRCLEGGDLLVISPRTLLIGCSERTSAQTIERLASEALFPTFAELERVFAVLLPEERSVMHLDTVLTQIDDKLFLGHRPLVAGGAARDPLPVVCLRRDRPPAIEQNATLLDVLKSELGSDTKLVPCGGEEPLHQEREQWTDGANAVCLGPGKIILYARNRYTIAALCEHGFEEVRLHVVQSTAERRDLIEQGMNRPRTIFSFSGSELSRARGGGRCLTMPLWREAVGC